MDELENFTPFDTQTVPPNEFEVLRLMRIVNLLVPKIKALDKCSNKRCSVGPNLGHSSGEFGS